jgi:putative MATE family efflux protein
MHSPVSAQENALLTRPIPGLLRMLAVPAGMGFFFNTMFNVVDTFYGGLVSTQALAAMSLSFPIFFLIIAVGSGISTGATALMGHSLGGGKFQQARIYAAQTLSFSLIHGMLLTIVGLAASPVLFRILGASGSYLLMARSYMDVIFYGTVFFFLNFALNANLNASGDTRSFRNFLIAGFFLNLALDPWLLFGGLGVPPLGLPGIAAATLIVQMAGNCYLLVRAGKTGLFSGFRLSYLLPRKAIYTDLARQGFPASLNMLTVALGVFVITWFLSRFGRDAVAAYGIATRLEQLALLPIMGLNIATLTLVAQNNGALLLQRVHDIIVTALRIGVSITIPVGIAAYLLAEELMGLFSRDPVVIAIGAGYLHVAAFVFCAYVILYINVNALQGMKRPQFAVWIGLLRQVAAPVPVFWFLAILLGWGIRGIWLGILLVTWTAAVVSILYVRRTVRQMRSNGSGGMDGGRARDGVEMN